MALSEWAGKFSFNLKRWILYVSIHLIISVSLHSRYRYLPADHAGRQGKPKERFDPIGFQVVHTSQVHGISSTIRISGCILTCCYEIHIVCTCLPIC